MAFSHLSLTSGMRHARLPYMNLVARVPLGMLVAVLLAAGGLSAAKRKSFTEATFERKGNKLFVTIDGKTGRVLDLERGGAKVNPIFDVHLSKEGICRIQLGGAEEAMWLVLLGKEGTVSPLRWYHLERPNGRDSREVKLYTNGRPSFMRDENGVDWATEPWTFARTPSREDKEDAVTKDLTAYQFWREPKLRVTGYLETYLPDAVAEMAMDKMFLRLLPKAVQDDIGPGLDDMQSANVQLVEEKVGEDFVPKKVEYVKPSDLSKIVAGFHIYPKVLRWFNNRLTTRKEREEILVREIYPLTAAAKEMLDAQRRSLRLVSAILDASY